MNKSFQHHNFHIANLRANLRNAEAISKISVDNAHKSFNVKSEINHLKSSIKGNIPQLLPIHFTDLRHNFAQVLDIAIQSMATRLKIAILHDGEQFSSEEIKKNVDSLKLRNLRSLLKARIFNPDQQNSVTAESEFLAFLNSSQNEILIVPQEFIVGAELCSVIYLSTDGYSFNSSFRCTLFRAVENLFVIHSYDNNSTGFTSLKGFKLNTQYLECAEEMRMYDYNIKCMTCLREESAKRQISEDNASGLSGVINENPSALNRSRETKSEIKKRYSQRLQRGGIVAATSKPKKVKNRMSLFYDIDETESIDQRDFIICKACYYACHYEHEIVQVQTNYDPLCVCKDLSMCKI